MKNIYPEKHAKSRTKKVTRIVKNGQPRILHERYTTQQNFINLLPGIQQQQKNYVTQKQLKEQK